MTGRSASSARTAEESQNAENRYIWRGTFLSKEFLPCSDESFMRKLLVVLAIIIRLY
jgi:hypothetical protein